MTHPSPSNPQKVLVTGALPYANGPIHLGHLVEYVQADIYARFLRSCGVDATYLCADDTHGTPIELNAAKQGLTPEAFIARWFESHQADFRDFQVAFDQYGSTNSAENRHYAGLIYERLKAAGDIERRDIEQTWCEQDRRFLPDRFVRGTCPNCKAPDQFGDVCDKCGRTHEPTALIDPRCSLCGTPPSRKSSTHLFFKLSRHAEELNRFIRDARFVHPGVSAQLQQFFEKGLADWDISRDGPYFGFPIPGETDKFFYVWLDAPIGYIATTEQWAKATGRAGSALDIWGKDSGARIVHFIGKDIVYFHALFWPTVLKVAELHRPDRLVVHGHLTVNGEKMSKSKGTFISARQYLEALDPSYLRFFYAANLGPGVEDLDLSLTEFRLRVNADLVNNIGNLANRSLTLLAGPMGGQLHAGGNGPGRALVEEALTKAKAVREAFEQLDYRAALKGICEISQAANGFLQNAAPWAKQKTDKEGAREDLSDVADVAYLVAGLLQPVVPVLAQKLFAQLGATPLTYAQLAHAHYPLLDRSKPIGTPEPLIARLEETQVNALVPTTQAGAAPAPVSEKKPEEKKGSPPAKAPAEPAAEIEYADFAKVALKVGKVVAAEPVPKADKLLKLTVDVGEGTPRTIAAGIALSYRPEQLVGRNVVVVANLKPRALRGIESRGMLLAAGADEKSLSLVDPGPLPPGSEVK